MQHYGTKHGSQHSAQLVAWSIADSQPPAAAHTIDTSAHDPQQELLPVGAGDGETDRYSRVVCLEQVAAVEVDS